MLSKYSVVELEWWFEWIQMATSYEVRSVSLLWATHTLTHS